MLAFPSMLIGPATEAGMKTPIFGDNDDYDPNEFPHFHVFCAVQLGRRMADMGEHWKNAEVIAAISDEDIKSLTLEDLLSRGLSYSS